MDLGTLPVGFRIKCKENAISIADSRVTFSDIDSVH
jgi:hypothetical protein